MSSYNLLKKIIYLIIIFSITVTCKTTATTVTVGNVPDRNMLSANGVILQYRFEVVKVYPHDTTSFTQGLSIKNGVLYESTGLNGKSVISKIELSKNFLLDKFILNKIYFGEGSTIFNNKLIQLTWKSKVGFIYSLNNLKMLNKFHFPYDGWGITNDGKFLITSNGSSTIRFFDPETFNEMKKLEIFDENGAVNNLNELEYIKGFIYANIWYKDLIVIISPKTGKVVGRLNLKGLLESQGVIRKGKAVLNGIAYDVSSDKLYVTGKLWPFLFQIKMVPY